jgi:hypothetical protein
MATTNFAKLVMAVRSFSIFNPASEMFKYGYALVTRTFSITSMVLVMLLCSCSEDLGGLDNTGLMSTKPVEPELPTVKVTVDSIRQEAIVDFTYNGKVQSFTVKAQLTPEKEHIIEAENLPIASFTASATDTVGTSYSKTYTYPYGNGEDLVFKNVLKTSADKLSVELAAGVTVGVKFGSMSHNPVKGSDNKQLSKPRSDEYESSYQTAYSGSASWSTFGAKNDKSFEIPVIADNYRNVMNGKGQADIQEHIERKLDPENDLENVTVWLTDNGEAYGDTVRLKLHYGLTVEKPNLGEYTVTSADDYQMTTTATGNWGEWKSTSDSRVKRQEMPASGIMWDKDADNPQIATSWTLFREKASVVINDVTINVPAADYNIISDVCNKPEKASASDKTGFDLYNATDKLVAKYSSETEYDELKGEEKAKLYVKQSDAVITGAQFTPSYERVEKSLNLKMAVKPVLSDGTKGKTENCDTSLPEDWKAVSNWSTKTDNEQNCSSQDINIISDKAVKDTTITVGKGVWKATKHEVVAEETVIVALGNVQTNKWVGHYWTDIEFTYAEKYEYDGDAFKFNAPTVSVGTQSITKGETDVLTQNYNYSISGRLNFKDITRKDDAKGVISVTNDDYIVNYDYTDNFTFMVEGTVGTIKITENWKSGKVSQTTANFKYDSAKVEIIDVTSTEDKVEETTEDITENITNTIARESDEFKFDEQFVTYRVPVYRASFGKKNYEVKLTRARNIVYEDKAKGIKIEIKNPTGSYSNSLSPFVMSSSTVQSNLDTLQTWTRDNTFTIKVGSDTKTYVAKGTIYTSKAYQKPAKKLVRIDVTKNDSWSGLYTGKDATLTKVYDDGTSEAIPVSKGFNGNSSATGVTSTEDNVRESLSSVGNPSLISSNAKNEGKWSWNENTYEIRQSGSRDSGSRDYKWTVTIAENVKYSDTIEGQNVVVEWSNPSMSTSNSASDFTKTGETAVSGGKNQIWTRSNDLLLTLAGQTVTIANTGVINTFVKDEEPPVEPEIKATITSIPQNVAFTPARDGETAHGLLLKLSNGNCIPVGKYGNTVVWGKEVKDEGYNGAGFIANASALMPGELVPCRISYENGEVILFETMYNGSWAPIDRPSFLKAQSAGWNNSGNLWEDKTGEFTWSSKQLNGAVEITIGNESHTFEGLAVAKTRGSRR